MPKKSKMLVLVDDSAHSRVAVRFACKEAEGLKCKVELLHVLDASEFNTLFVAGEALREERMAEAEKLLKDMAKQIKDFSSIKPSFNIREGLLSEQVVKAIDEDGTVNMLILGKAPEEASKSDLITMLSAELVGKILIPMMIVPGSLTDKQIEELT